MGGVIMKRFPNPFNILLALILLFIAFAAPAFAAFSLNPISWIKSALESGGWTVLAYILTAVLALGIFGTVMALRIIKTLRETGELFIAFADAVADHNVTPAEIRGIIASARDVVDVWKKTPEQFKSPEG